MELDSYRYRERNNVWRLDSPSVVVVRDLQREEESEASKKEIRWYHFSASPQLTQMTGRHTIGSSLKVILVELVWES